VSRMQRTKGATFERDICKAFADATGREIKREIGQARDGGYDIAVGPLLVECKRRKTLGTVYGWLQQAIDAVPLYMARKGAGIVPIPVVVARQDGDTAPIVILRLEDFLTLTRDKL
jgi:hypothetical protein